MTRFSPDDLRQKIANGFANLGVQQDAARSVAQALVAAEIEGQGGHGLSRVASYAAQVRTGKVQGAARPVATRPKPAQLIVDAGYGFAYPAIDLAIAELPKMAEAQGIATALITRSHHGGQFSQHVERLAKAGVLAIMVGNTPKAMAVWGGKTAKIGTNPIAFAAPRPDGPPLVIDLSLSMVARGKVMAAARNDAPIPEGWALDADGAPTTDAKAAMDGTMVPLGGAKGAALALMVEVLAAPLTGALTSSKASSLFDGEGDPPGLGQAIIAISPGDGFGDRIADLLTDLASEDGIRLPGTRRHALRDRAEVEGVNVSDAFLADINSLSQ